MARMRAGVPRTADACPAVVAVADAIAADSPSVAAGRTAGCIEHPQLVEPDEAQQMASKMQMQHGWTTTDP
mgnify:CR=1 FL=1